MNTKPFPFRSPRLSALTVASLGLLTCSTLMAQTSAGAAGDTAVKPQVLLHFSGDTGNAIGARPYAPPVLSADGKTLIGTTLAGGPGYSVYSHQQSVGYRLTLADLGYLGQVLGVDFGHQFTNSMLDRSGQLWGGAAQAGSAGSNGIFFSRGVDGQFTLAAPPDAAQTSVANFSPKGQAAMDGSNNIYFSSGMQSSNCSATDVDNANTLWRRSASGVTERVVRFCQFLEQSGVDSRGRPVYRHTKGGQPVALIWSEADQALYGLTQVTAAGTVPSIPGTDNGGKSVGTLFRISKAALDAGLTAQDGDKIEVLHTFALGRDGAPVVQLALVSGDSRASSLVEDDAWLYGTTYQTSATNAANGTVWRVRKNDPTSFTVVHRFQADAGLDGTAQADGAGPMGPLVRAADGNIYGTTARDARVVTTGGSQGAGTVFRLRVGQAADRSDDKVEILHRFDVEAEGGRPVGLSAGPVVGGVQKLYGANRFGGASGDAVGAAAMSSSGNGTLFSIDLTLPTASFTQALTASAATAAVGATVQLSWSTKQAQACTATGAWSGAQQVNGSNVPVVLTKAGDNLFTLSCSSENDGPAVTSSVTVQGQAVQPEPQPPVSGGSGGGGGPLSAWLLAPLAALALARVRRQKHR